MNLYFLVLITHLFFYHNLFYYFNSYLILYYSVNLNYCLFHFITLFNPKFKFYFNDLFITFIYVNWLFHKKYFLNFY